MLRRQDVDIIYDIVKNKYRNKPFIFADVWKTLVKEAKLSKEEQADRMGSVYTDILQDSRFMYGGNKKWMLREYATQEEIAKLQNALYDFNPEVVEEGFETNVSHDLDDEEIYESDQDNKEIVDEDEAEAYEDIKSGLSKNKDKDEE